MKRLIIVCEGQTEQAFCKTNLQQHFQGKGILTYTPLIKHSRGGIVKWPILKQQIETHLKVEGDAYVTTFIDYYGLYSKYSFPSWDDCERITDRSSRMDALEAAMKNDIHDDYRYRFIPYLQLHEFEGLLFNDINIIRQQIPANDLVGEIELVDTFNAYTNPEMINNVRHTSPSHRLARIIKGYNKVVYGDILAEAIGLQRMRSKAPRFNSWITQLEGI